MTAPGHYCAQCRNLDVCCARQACALDAPASAPPSSPASPPLLTDIVGIATVFLALGIPVARLLLMAGQ